MHLPMKEITNIFKTKANTIARKSFQNVTRDSIHVYIVTIICMRLCTYNAHNGLYVCGLFKIEA